uniref:Uncharacterized protein n=1 Tax=Arundo donax TaxID=35708 RepID=A0A0A9BWU5_ARUDO
MPSALLFGERGQFSIPMKGQLQFVHDTSIEQQICKCNYLQLKFDELLAETSTKYARAEMGETTNGIPLKLLRVILQPSVLNLEPNNPCKIL